MIQFIRNKSGIKIAMVCASCQNCIVGDPVDLKGEFRKCNFDKLASKVVKPTDYCINWKCREPYITAGTKEPGKIKTQDFIQFVTNFRLAENKDGQDTRIKSKDLANPEYVRQLYAEANPGKSIYMDI